MRADRLINIMILLQNRGKMTAKELANELEVSDRTILRDMDALSTAGIPIVSDRGTAGGWRLLDNFRSKLSGLNIDDMKSLFLFPSGKLLEDLGLNSQALDTRQKLLAAIPGSYRDEAQAMWERIYIDSSTWRQSKEKMHALETVQQAVWENKKLKIHYEQADGEQKERLLEPLGLVAKGNRWYLVASRDGELRNYRVSRIHTAKVENEVFRRPLNFNLAAYWEQSKVEFIQNLPKYDVQVEIHPAIIKRINFTGKFVQMIKTEIPNGDKWIPATLRFNDKQEAIEFILGFSNKIKVISPKDLPNKVVSLAMSVIDFYSNE
ncbi:Predicted DNA-binding transcriptional regulator YafY, contains an HTH and WYL domains [Lentibacillus halodurans]|uniref:Predicted DNA-binding transcriptional regulator YafY, contains an HTH and WYL domains n=1 Tax=Lentibacillus halodurans TaxID=237679 RepID=A0A1I0ZFL5_9BACI|nr:YafY family protein [Lentibacillus halodurans]SFB22983.1 Predicted DNA-binding transcriptional regulator YafY, contains an HTH and WYL domains [Lentibacillus halodurans]